MILILIGVCGRHLGRIAKDARASTDPRGSWMILDVLVVQQGELALRTREHPSPMRVGLRGFRCLAGAIANLVLGHFCLRVLIFE